jgi:small acid-soluble spore protein L (minor)
MSVVTPSKFFKKTGDNMHGGENMSKNNGRNRGTKASGVNPQGYDATFTPNPKSRLEEAAKKINTK